MCAVLIVTHSNADNVIKLITALNSNINLKKHTLHFFVGCSSQKAFLTIKEFAIEQPTISFYKVNEKSFWARSFQTVFQKINAQDFNMFLHVNDDFEADNIKTVNLTFIMDENLLTYADIYDHDKKGIFGGKQNVGLKFTFSEKDADVFNTNFFSASMHKVSNFMPSYRFSHAFLDYALSYQLLKNIKKINRLKFETKYETYSTRLKHFSNFKDIKNSRLNPMDSFMMYYYFNNYPKAICAAAICLLKIIIYKFKLKERN